MELNDANGPVSVMGVIQLLIPIVTFAMGYFLTDIGYKRDRKLSIVREKFEKLYHPFFMLINELGTETEDGAGFAFDTENTAVLKRFFDHLFTNVHLASCEGQQLILETRMLFVSEIAKGDGIDKEKEQLFEKSISALFLHLLQEYIQSAKALGYDVGFVEGHTGIIES